MSKKPVNNQKVWVKLLDGDQFFGYVFIPEGIRLQDMLNDSRFFVPINKHMNDRGSKAEDIYSMIMINKTTIASVEPR